MEVLTYTTGANTFNLNGSDYNRNHIAVKSQDRVKIVGAFDSLIVLTIPTLFSDYQVTIDNVTNTYTSADALTTALNEIVWFGGDVLNPGGSADGNETPIVRTDAVTGVSPTAGEAPSPQAGDSATVFLNDGVKEYWVYTTAWNLTYTEPAPTGGTGTVDVVSNVANNVILGRTTAGSGDSEELSPASVRTLLNVEDGASADQNATEIIALLDAQLGGTDWRTPGNTAQQVAFSTTITFDGNKNTTFGTVTDNTHNQAGTIAFTYDFTNAVENSVRTIEIVSDGNTITVPNGGTGTHKILNNTANLTSAANVITPVNGERYLLMFWYANDVVTLSIVDAPVIVSDTTPPTFTIAPAITNVLDTSFDVVATHSENATMFAVVVPNGAAAPTIAEIIAGTGSGGSGQAGSGNAADTGGGAVISITGLVTATAYDIHVVSRDAAGNEQASSTLLQQTTGTSYPAMVSTHSLVIDQTNEGAEFRQAGVVPGNGTQDFVQTYEVWYKTPASVASTANIIAIGDDGFAAKIIIRRTGDGRVVFQKATSAGNNVVWNTPAATVVADTWYHIFVTDDRLNVADSVKIYIDGTRLIGTANPLVSGTYSGIPAESTNPKVAVPFVTGNYGEGKIAMYRQFDIEMSAANAVTLYNGGTPAGAAAFLSNILLEARLNNNYVATVGTDGVAIGSATFDTDVPT